MATDPLPGYGIKCEPDTSYSAGYFQTPPHALQDSIPEGNEDGMDFSGLLEMDDKTLSGQYEPRRGSNRTLDISCRAHGRRLDLKHLI